MAYKDAICKACLGVTQDPLFVVIVADIPMPDSWSKKKRKEMLLQYHRSKPDWDNIGKGICDALWESDSVIAVGTTIKRWAETGSLFITVTGANEA
jgi:Holliday junction resolvase RusA-like endonuclease